MRGPQDLSWLADVTGITLMRGDPLAALGFLNPMVAGAAMAFSSASVVGNALFLRSWNPLSNGQGRSSSRAIANRFAS